MLYSLFRFCVRVIFSMTLRIKIDGAENLVCGGCILACSHLSHLDPICLSAILPRKIHWLARIEFYRKKWSASLLRRVEAIPLNRIGVPVRAMKNSIAIAGSGGVVGIFPEGEITIGPASVLRGGPVKKGACLIAQHSGKPIVPCVILGTHELLRVEPWLPFLRGRLWVACGEPIAPILEARSKKQAREQMAEQLKIAMRKLFADLKQRHRLPDTIAR